MKLHKLNISIITLFLLAFTVTPAHAQFGGLVNKARGKIDKAQPQGNQPVTPTANDARTGQPPRSHNDNSTQAPPRTTSSSNRDLSWTQFKCDPEFTRMANEASLREMVLSNVQDFGRGGLIVFSKQPLAKKNPTLADGVTTFKAGEPIYMNVVLPEAQDHENFLRLPGDVIMTVGDTKQCESGTYKHTLYIDYGRVGNLPQTFTLDFQPQGGKSAKYQQQVKGISEVLRALPPGIHIIPVRLDIALGAFYYDNRDGQANDDAIKAALADVRMPPPAVRMPALEKQIMSNWNSESGSTLLRVVFTDRGWSPLRHPDNTIRGRYITAVVAKKENGKCVRQTQLWAQNYNGGSYSGLFLEGSQGGEEMACENAMK
jgi:hypothetical protein